MYFCVKWNVRIFPTMKKTVRYRYKTTRFFNESQTLMFFLNY